MCRMRDMSCVAFWSRPRGELAGRLGRVGWGLFFLWIGVSLLLDLGWGIGLLGVGVLTLAMQAVRRSFRLELEMFWVAAGFAFTAAGVWELAAVTVSFGPILLMALGIVVTVSGLGTRRDRTRSRPG